VLPPSTSRRGHVDLRRPRDRSRAGRPVGGGEPREEGPLGGAARAPQRAGRLRHVALHELSGIGPPERRGSLWHYLDALGVASRVDFLPVPELYRSVLPDLDLVLPPGVERYEDTLCQAFPHEAEGIRRFLGRVHQVARDLGALERDLGRPLPELLRRLAREPARLATAARYLPATWGQVLDRDVSDPRARAVLSQYWGYFGLPPSRVSFLYFAIGLHGYMVQGPAYVNGRSQALASAFVRVLEEHGGRVRFNCGVRRILVEHGRAAGVVTEHGDELRAKAVLSNADPITTCRDLLDGGAPAAFERSLEHRTVAPSSFNVYLGVNATAESLGLRCHENFVSTTADFEAVAAGMRTLDAPQTTLVTCYNAVDPGISPPGTCEVVLTTLYDGAAWARLPAARYDETKHRIAGAMLDAAEGLAPGLRDAVEVLEIATPLTNMRYTSALGGSIYGFDATAHDHTVLRPGHRGPLPGLYFAGAWTQPGGGFEPCMISGRMAAGAVHADLARQHKEATA
jgi:prolycopene isomerase